MLALGYKVEFVPSNTIKRIYLELTDKCNLNCTMCYRREWEDIETDMEDETLERFYKEIKRIDGLEEIVLGGIGEPTFHPKFLEVLERLKNYKLHITTNGTLLTEELLEKIVDTVEGITISVDGVGEVFQDIRGIGLEAVVKNIYRLQELKKKKQSIYPKVQLQFVASKKNINDVFQVIDLASKIGVGQVIISNLIPQSLKDQKDVLYTLEENPEGKNLRHRIRNYAQGKGIYVYQPEVEKKTERGCNFINDITTFISVNGDVVPCFRLSHNYKEYVFGREKQVTKHVLGNIKETPLLDIWNDRAYQYFRYKIHTNNYPSCMDCDLVSGCELAKETLEDCYGITPSCADCLWGRKFVVCPPIATPTLL